MANNASLIPPHQIYSQMMASKSDPFIICAAAVCRHNRQPNDRMIIEGGAISSASKNGCKTRIQMVWLMVKPCLSGRIFAAACPNLLSMTHDANLDSEGLWFKMK